MPTANTPSRPPNVIFVLTDDQGSGDLGCAGNPVINTPQIDRMHAESVRLTNFHVGPTCAPTRAGLMTGHYANSTGVWHTIGGRSLLRENEWTLASALRENGYRTGIFGKWHLGDPYPYRPQDRGFETCVTHGGGGISQAPDHWGNDYFDDTFSVNGEPKAFEGYCTDVFFNEALSFISSNRDRPFFCYLPTNAPHEPYNVEDKYFHRYRGKVPDRALVTDSQRVPDPIKWRQSAVMTNRWRLINGQELYDMTKDREQRDDVAADHPDVVEALRQEYDAWWDIVSTRFSEETPMHLGAQDAPEVVLTCQDWRNGNCVLPYDQGHIREGMVAMGRWEVDVRRAGVYTIELRRWPEEAGHPIMSGIDGDDVAWRRDWIADWCWRYYTGGKALPIRQAELTIQGLKTTQDVFTGDTASVFTVRLEPGPTQLYACFKGGTEDEPLSVGAYYVTVRYGPQGPAEE